MEFGGAPSLIVRTEMISHGVTLLQAATEDLQKLGANRKKRIGLWASRHRYADTPVCRYAHLDDHEGRGSVNTLRTVNLVIGRRGATLRLVSLLLAAAIDVLGPQAIVKADPITELRSLSVFKDADLRKLAQRTSFVYRPKQRTVPMKCRMRP
jgi:hypothetical protein